MSIKSALAGEVAEGADLAAARRALTGVFDAFVLHVQPPHDRPEAFYPKLGPKETERHAPSPTGGLTLNRGQARSCGTLPPRRRAQMEGSALPMRSGSIGFRSGPGKTCKMTQTSLVAFL